MATIIRIKSRQAEKLHEHAKKAYMCMKKLVKCIEDYVPIEDEEYDERDDDDMGYQDDDDNDMKANRKRGNQGGGAGRYGRDRY